MEPNPSCLHVLRPERSLCDACLEDGTVRFRIDQLVHKDFPEWPSLGSFPSGHPVWVCYHRAVDAVRVMCLAVWVGKAQVICLCESHWLQALKLLHLPVVSDLTTDRVNEKSES